MSAHAAGAAGTGAPFAYAPHVEGPAARMRARGMRSAETYGRAVAAGRVDQEVAAQLIARKMREALHSPPPSGPEAADADAQRSGIGDDAIRDFAQAYLREGIAAAEAAEPEPEPSSAPEHGPFAFADGPAADGALGRFLSVPHWLSRDLEPPEPLLGEVVTKTTRLFIGGPTGLGKSHLGMAMAAGMATGQGFLHWRASRPARVLYLDGEMSRDLVQERLADLARRSGGADLSSLFVMCAEDCEEISDRCPHLGTFGPLNTEAGQGFLKGLIDELARQEPLDAVFLDNRMSLLSGDMKEEQPWTDTMPLVKELTARRIAQIWIDHMGNATDRIYGTKTKEWQFDAVALLAKPEAAECAGADIAFTLDFTKARRRSPSNRADFQRVAISMVGDAWTSTAAQTAPRGGRPLTAAEQGWFNDIVSMFAEKGATVERRVPGSTKGVPGPLVPTLTHQQVRVGLQQRERLTTAPNASLTGATARSSTPTSTPSRIRVR